MNQEGNHSDPVPEFARSFSYKLEKKFQKVKRYLSNINSADVEKSLSRSNGVCKQKRDTWLDENDDVSEVSIPFHVDIIVVCDVFAKYL